jgi:hypothetical protein
VPVPPLPLPDLPPVPGTGANNDRGGGSSPVPSLPTLSAKTRSSSSDAQSRLLDYLLAP